MTRKITRALARIRLGLQGCLFLGNLESLRDWGHARDYVEMQWLMLQQDAPEDFVIASGRQYSVRAFVEAAAAQLGMTIEWQGRGVDEVGIIAAVAENRLVSDPPGCMAAVPGQTIVRVDPRYFRPTEVDTLLGNAAKARDKLGWEPKIGFEELVKEMVGADLRIARRDRLCMENGF